MTSTIKNPEEQVDLYKQNSDRLSLIINPLRTATYEIDVEWKRIGAALEEYGYDYGGLEMDPDFQRGHVWSTAQQQAFIENVLRGVVSLAGLTVQFNCANWGSDRKQEDQARDLPDGFQCLDGLQRITAVLKFLSGEVRPFGLTVDDFKNSSFSIGRRFRFRLAVHDFTRRTDLLKHYLDMNTGGTPHSPEEIKRVRELLKDA